MRIHAVVCDDEAPEREYLRSLTEKWAQDKAHSVKISCFDSAEAFLFAYDQDKSFDILLLDIQMKAVDGLTLARRLRAEGSGLQIVFITGYPDFMAEGYDVSALHYLIKPVSEQNLFAVLDRAAGQIRVSIRTVLLPLHEGNLRFPVDEIVYAEAFSHSIEINTTSQTFKLKTTLRDLERLLGEGFFRCHRSYIVGLSHVRMITRATMVLTGNRVLPLSRKLYDAANQAFIRFN
ncbi:MAG: response regulator transcription factor [Clostridiales bacterium]|nr:response regulator transcription factor [Clostridiales bacterium]